MAMGRREKDIKLLVEKFIRLVESLNPGERLSIRKVSSKKPVRAARRRVGRSKTDKSKTDKSAGGDSKARE